MSDASRVPRACFSAGGLLVLSLNVSRLSWVDVNDSPPFGLCLQLTANVDSITRNALERYPVMYIRCEVTLKTVCTDITLLHLC